MDSVAGAAGDLSQSITIIITTSACPSNPHTEMLEFVVGSLALSPGLAGCRKLIMCDGHKNYDTSIHKRQSLKRGIIDDDLAARYKSYMDRVDALVQTDERFANSEVMRLPERHGFGWAVMVAMRRARTPYVLVVQHDYELVRGIDFKGLVKVMQEQCDVKYINLLSKSTENYQEYVCGRYEIKIKPRVLSDGKILVPLLFWYDKPHLADRRHYLELVFGVRELEADEATALAAVDPEPPQELSSEHRSRVAVCAGAGRKPGEEVKGGTPAEAGTEGGEKHQAEEESKGNDAPMQYLKETAWRGRQYLVKKGDFVEDTFGAYALKQMKENMQGEHPRFGTWVYDAGDGEFLCRHLHGRRFLTEQMKADKGYVGRVRLPLAGETAATQADTVVGLTSTLPVQATENDTETIASDIANLDISVDPAR